MKWPQEPELISIAISTSSKQPYILGFLITRNLTLSDLGIGRELKGAI
jgi:hypothetical protein